MPMPFMSGLGEPRSSQSPSLDGPPPHFPPRPAGADTLSLMGARSESDITGSGGAGTPQREVVKALAGLMQSVNTLQSLFPGQISPQFLAEVERLSAELPQAAQMLGQQSAMGAMGMASALTPGGGIGGNSMPLAFGEESAPSSGMPQRM